MPKNDPIARFARLPLRHRFHIVEELGCQLKPGPSPQKHAEATLGHIRTPDELKRLAELLNEVEGNGN